MPHSKSFSKIGLVGKPSSKAAQESIDGLIKVINQLGLSIFLPEANDVAFPVASDKEINKTITYLPFEKLGEQCNLVIVVGGDGSMLKAARDLINSQVPLLGINRGHLGFLTDIRPTEIESRVPPILNGQYSLENRFLLHAEVFRGDEAIGSSSAVNDIVLYPGEIARMIQFELYMDRQFVYSQRSDGLIVSTPTGSTAYSLSGGGPILDPQTDTIVLVPMCPHTLTSRPIAVNKHKVIDLVISESNPHNPKLSCDGQVIIDLAPGDRIRIKQYPLQMRLVHPLDYDYFEVLRTKLGWGQKL
ncbi:MAG: NAD(+) kinase [Kangiellaceae bacterium]